jgi:uncharacterized protein with PIN domain
MTQRQPRIYLDEDVDVLLATLLSARGYDVEHAKDAAQLGKSDEAQLRYATESGRVILSHNRMHFEALASAWFEQAESHAGIIIAGRRPIHELARRTLVLLADVSADALIDNIRYI